jgi:hypothetical protein
LSFS